MLQTGAGWRRGARWRWLRGPAVNITWVSVTDHPGGGGAAIGVYFIYFYFLVCLVFKMFYDAKKKDYIYSVLKIYIYNR